MLCLLEWLTPLCCDNVMFIRMVYSVMFLIMLCLLEWFTPLCCGNVMLVRLVYSVML